MALRPASLVLLIVAFIFSCNTTETTRKEPAEINASFKLLQERFLDSFWKQNPANAISVGYGKYYDQLKIHDSGAIRRDVAFSRKWLDSLKTYNYDALDAGEKINYNIIRNALESNIWNIDTFKALEWNPAQYNIGSACYGILNQTDVSLNQKTFQFIRIPAK